MHLKSIVINQAAKSHQPDNNLPWLKFKFKRHVKTRATHCQPIIPPQQCSAGPFLVKIGDLSLILDHLPVSSLCKELSTFPKSDV